MILVVYKPTPVQTCTTVQAGYTATPVLTCTTVQAGYKATLVLTCTTVQAGYKITPVLTCTTVQAGYSTTPVQTCTTVQAGYSTTPVQTCTTVQAGYTATPIQTCPVASPMAYLIPQNFLDNVQNFPGLWEDEGAMAILPKLIHQGEEDAHLACLPNQHRVVQQLYFCCCTFQGAGQLQFMFYHSVREKTTQFSSTQKTLIIPQGAILLWSWQARKIMNP